MRIVDKLLAALDDLGSPGMSGKTRACQIVS